MRKILLSISIALFSFFTQANDNLEIGTTWTYTKEGSEVGGFSYYEQCVNFEVVEHVLLHDTLCAKVLVTTCKNSDLWQ